MSEVKRGEPVQRLEERPIQYDRLLLRAIAGDRAEDQRAFWDARSRRSRRFSRASTGGETDFLERRF